MAGVVLTATGARTFLGQKVLRPDDAAFEIPITGEAEAPGTPPLPGFRAYVRLGVEHILTGIDHLLFLLGLLVVCRRFRTVAAIVTCFTVAHSVTLALAALEVVTLSSRVVEPLIAATIVLVGVENLMRGDEPRGALGCWRSRSGSCTASASRARSRRSASAPPARRSSVRWSRSTSASRSASSPSPRRCCSLIWKLRALPAFARTGENRFLDRRSPSGSSGSCDDLSGDVAIGRWITRQSTRRSHVRAAYETLPTKKRSTMAATASELRRIYSYLLGDHAHPERLPALQGALASVIRDDPRRAPTPIGCCRSPTAGSTPR